jgi:hypothetical protein
MSLVTTDPNCNSWGVPLNPQNFGVDRDNTCEYGCVRCQTWHKYGDPLFGPHLADQSKHGYQTRRRTAAERILWDFLAAIAE